MSKCNSYEEKLIFNDFPPSIENSTNHHLINNNSNHCERSSNNNISLEADTLNSRVSKDSISWLDYDRKKSNLNPDQIKTKIRQNLSEFYHNFSFKKQFFYCFPLFDLLRNYSAKDYLLIDIVAGFTLAIIHVPQGIAYSILIGIGPVYGLYTSFFPSLIYALIGTSQHISIGTMAVVDMMLREMVDDYNPIDNNNTFSVDLYHDKLYCIPNPDCIFATRVEIIVSICILTGLIQLLMGFCSMGSISMILSDQLISGFSCGASVHVVISQIASVIQIKNKPIKSGSFTLVKKLIQTIFNIGTFSYTALLISFIAFVVIVITKEILEPLLRKHSFKIPIPIDLIVILCATAGTKYLNLNNEPYNIWIMGDIPTGIPKPNLPRFDYMSPLIKGTISIAVVSFAINLSLAKIYSKKHGYTIRANQEFIAIGVANVISSLFLSFPSTASLSRTSMMGTYAKSQVSSLISCCVLLSILLYFAPYLYHLPKCVVATIIIISQKPIVLQIKDLSKSWKLSRYEGLIWIFTFLGVILLGIDVGLMVGIIFSILTIIMRFYSPKLRLLGQFMLTDIYVDIEQHSVAKEIPGTKILQFSSPLFFINKELFQEKIFKKSLNKQKFQGHSDIDAKSVRSIILDCSAMSFIDSAGVEVISQISNELYQRKIRVALAACPQSVITMLTKMDFFNKSPHVAIFPSVHEAVLKVENYSFSEKITEQL